MEVAGGKLEPSAVVPAFGPLLHMHNELAWNKLNAEAHGSALGAHILTLLSPRRRLSNATSHAAFTYISAHDVNLLYLRQLLGVNWQVARYYFDVLA